MKQGIAACPPRITDPPARVPQNVPRRRGLFEDGARSVWPATLELSKYSRTTWNVCTNITQPTQSNPLSLPSLLNLPSFCLALRVGVAVVGPPRVYVYVTPAHADAWHALASARRVGRGAAVSQTGGRQQNKIWAGRAGGDRACARSHSLSVRARRLSLHLSKT